MYVYDDETDSIYVQFSNDNIIESKEKEKENDVVVDYNDKDEIMAVKILNVKYNEPFFQDH